MRHIYDFHRTSNQPSPRYRHRKSASGRKEKIFGLLLIMIIGAWIYAFYFSPFFSIQDVRIDGNETIARDLLDHIVAAEGKNIFRFNTGKALERVRAQYFLEDATLLKTYPQEIYLNIKEKHPVFALKMPNLSYLLDATGLVMEINSASSTTSSTISRANGLPVIEETTDRMLDIRASAIDSKKIDAVRFFTKSLKDEDNIDITKSVFSSDEPDVITFKTAAGFDVITSYKEDQKAQMFKLTTFLKAHTDTKQLLYINARFVDRVYFKFR